MKKTILIPFLLYTVLILSVSADDFEDFIQVSSKVAANYNRGVVTRGTRFDKEYQMNLELMQKLATRVQRVIRKLQLGQDFDFPWIAMELEKIYRGGQEQAASATRNKNGKNSRSGQTRLDPYSESPDGILKVLTNDVKELRKMKFTTDDGGSIKTSLETSRKLLEFKRLIAFFRMNYRKIIKSPQQKKDFSLDKLFKNRLRRMSQLAVALMEIARQQYPDTMSRHNLHNEVTQLQKYFDAWEEFRVKTPSRSQNRRKKSPTPSRRLDGLNSVSAFHAEIDVSLRNINEQLNMWDQAGFRSDPPIQRAARNSNSDDPAAPLLQPSRKMDYSAMNQKQLNTLLQQRRQEIFRSNRSMDGFDRDAERRYLMTLSREQKRLYNESIRDFQQQGYSAGQAARSAILKVHTRIRMENKPLPAKEVIRILQALDRDQDRRQENNKDIDFKRERASID